MAGEDDVTVQGVMGIVRVVEIVRVENIVVKGEHVVECGIEGEVVAEVVVEEAVVDEEVIVEEVVEEVITKEEGMVIAVGLVGEEVFVERHWKGLGPEHTFWAAPSPLLLLLFRFVAVSIGVSCASGVVGTGVVGTGLLLAFFLALGAGRCPVM